MSKQKSDFKNQQINFIGRLEQNATIFFIVEEKETTGLNFLQKSFFTRASFKLNNEQVDTADNLDLTVNL